MFGQYSYHETIYRTIICFGTLFNNIYIKHTDPENKDLNLLKVPISYGPIQKFLARLEQKPDLRKRVALTLPRMSYELTSIRYDPSRKVSTMQTFKTLNKNSNKQVKVSMPAPYNLGFELSIITKYGDDMLQIIEQILPNFQPAFTVTTNLIDSIDEKRDIPFVMGEVGIQDNYEGDFEKRRNLIYTINFVAKINLFGPIAESTDSLIKKVQIDYFTDTNKNARRELRYIVTPRAIKDYNNDVACLLANNIDSIVTKFEVSDSTSLSENIYIAINDEEMYIKKIEGNTITVIRGSDNTQKSSHEIGDVINLINNDDDEMIEFGDDFGFNEGIFNFNDGKVYSTTKQMDVDL